MTTPPRRLPRRRPELVVRPIGDRGRYVVKDPRSGAYFQIGAREQFLLGRLDGVQTPVAVRSAFEAEFGEPLSDDDLSEFLDLATAQKFLAAAEPDVRPSVAALLGHQEDAAGRPDAIVPVWRPEPPAAAARRPEPAPPAPPRPPAPEGGPAAPEGGPAAPEQSLLFWRKSLFDPDRFFDRVLPAIGFFWTRGFVAASLAAVAAAAWVLVANWADLVSGFAGAVRWETAALVWVVLLAATTLHEFAHGLTLKRFGGEVREIGVLVMFFLPCLFCNVSDAWLIRERWKRLLVTLAGGYCDLCLWAAAVFVWRLTPPDALPNYIAFVAMTVLGARVLFNFNPFLKLDGYYMLGDWLEVPNLLQDGQARAKAHLRSLLWGAPRPPADPHGRALTLYGTASWLYGAAFLSVTVYGITKYFWGWLGSAGVAAAVGIAALLVRSQFQGLGGGEVRKMLAGRRARTAAWLVALAALAGLMTVPVSDRAGGPFRIRSGGKFELRAPAAAVLRELQFDEGDVVPPGAVVARLEVPDLASRSARRRAEAAEALAKLRLLEAGPNPAAAAELTDRVVRAERWHALAQGDLDRARTAHGQDLTRLDAQVVRCEAEVKQAAAALDRLTPLRGQGAISADEYEAAAARAAVCRGQLDQATAERQAARTRGVGAAETELAKRAKELADARGELAVLKAGPRPEEVTAARAALSRAEEEVRYLDELAGKLTLRAGRGGLVTTARPQERVGRLFQEGELVCEIEDASVLDVEVSLKEGQTVRVGADQEVELLARAFPFQTVKAKVRRVAPAARRPGERPDSTTAAAAAQAAPAPGTESEGVVSVYCVLDDGDPGLRPGMTGHARISRGERAAGIVLSESALRTFRIEFWR